MVNYVKDDPTCQSDIVFVGGAILRPFTEHDDRYQPPATAELQIDILAADTYIGVDFQGITLILEIKGPPGVQFVDHSHRNNFSWGIPSGALWVDDQAIPTAPTRALRCTGEPGSLLSGINNGRTFYIGVNGLPAGTGATISAVANADQVVAKTSSCRLQIENFHIGESILGYMM